MDERAKTILAIAFVVVALAVAIFMGFRSFREQQGEVVGEIEMFPGGKAGEIQRQQQGLPEGPPM